MLLHLFPHADCCEHEHRRWHGHDYGQMHALRKFLKEISAIKMIRDACLEAPLELNLVMFCFNFSSMISMATFYRTFRMGPFSDVFWGKYYRPSLGGLSSDASYGAFFRTSLLGTFVDTFYGGAFSDFLGKPFLDYSEGPFLGRSGTFFWFLGGTFFTDSLGHLFQSFWGTYTLCSRNLILDLFFVCHGLSITCLNTFLHIFSFLSFLNF